MTSQDRDFQDMEDRRGGGGGGGVVAAVIAVVAAVLLIAWAAGIVWALVGLGGLF